MAGQGETMELREFFLGVAEPGGPFHDLGWTRAGGDLFRWRHAGRGMERLTVYRGRCSRVSGWFSGGREGFQVSRPGLIYADCKESGGIVFNTRGKSGG